MKNTLPGSDDIQRSVLPNGIRLISRENRQSPSVAFGGFFPAGSLFDAPAQQGLASLTASALMRGTTSYTFQDIFQRLEDVGAGFGFSASVHTVSFRGRSLAEDLPQVLGLLASCLREPLFPEEDVAQLKAQVLTGFALREKDTESMAALAFDRLLYGADHPYGRPSDGFADTVAPLTPADLQTFHQRHYGPRDMVIAAVGAVSHADWHDWMADLLGDWENPAQPQPPALPPVQPPDAPRREHIQIPDKKQIDLVMGGLGPSRYADDFFPAMLGNTALGQFGMMGRIGAVVRQQAGLAYYAYSNLSANPGPGSWDISAGVNPDNLQKAVTLIENELRRFVAEGVLPDELEDVRRGILKRLPLSFESNAGVLGALLHIARYDLGWDYYRTYAERLLAIDVAQVNAAARRYLNPDALVFTSAGTLEQA